jgi:transposase InsO family protein
LVDAQAEGLALEMGVQVLRPRRFLPPEEGPRSWSDPLDRQDVNQVARELDLTETAVRFTPPAPDRLGVADITQQRTD